MKQPDDPTRAGHILDAAETIQRWIDGKSRAEFDADEVLQSAVAYQLQIIGEAASRLSAEFRRANPTIPWHDVIGMRHILVHAYERVAMDIVWTVATERLAALIDVVRPHAPPLEEE